MQDQANPAVRHTAASTTMFGGNSMHATSQKLRLAESEVHRTAHSQDLLEVPKRALLDRKAENHEIHLPRTKHGENRIEIAI
jgi:hypothetical protein